LFENSNWRKQLDGGALIEPQNAPPIIAGITSLAISKWLTFVAAVYVARTGEEFEEMLAGFAAGSSNDSGHGESRVGQGAFRH
jgi:hypothetical protein